MTMMVSLTALVLATAAPGAATGAAPLSLVLPNGLGASVTMLAQAPVIAVLPFDQEAAVVAPLPQPAPATPAANAAPVAAPAADGAQPPAAQPVPAQPAAATQGDAAAPAVPAGQGDVAAQPPADGAPTATNPGVVPDDAPPPGMLLRDPWEKPNRSIWKFDVFFERNLLGPVAHGYAAVVPQGARNHISNLILNLDEPLTTFNSLLQLKIGRAFKSGVRFVINSTVGIAGLFDVAAKNGLPARPADFGQTLARWGAKPGPYVMVPFIGPSDIRDGLGRLVDTFADPVGFVIGGVFSSPGGAARYLAEGVNWRQQNDGTIKAIYGAADPYAFARAAYSQQRAAKVQDVTGKAQALPDF